MERFSQKYEYVLGPHDIRGGKPTQRAQLVIDTLAAIKTHTRTEGRGAHIIAFSLARELGKQFGFGVYRGEGTFRRNNETDQSVRA